MTTASASGTVTVSTDPITVDAFGNLDIPIPDDDTLTEDIFSENVFASRFDGFVDTLEPALREFRVKGDVIPSVPGWLGKTVTAGVSVTTDGASPNGAGEATAIVDPVILFDEAEFQARYGGVCASVLGSACPAMTSLFDLQMSPFVGNGFLPDTGPSSTPIPLPAGAWLLGSAMASLVLLRKQVL